MMLLQTSSLGLKREPNPSLLPNNHRNSLTFQGRSKALQDVLESHKDIQNRRTTQSDNPTGSKMGLGGKLAYGLWAITGLTTAMIGSNWVYKYHTDKPQGEQAIALETKMTEYEKNTGSEWRKFNTWVDSAKQNKTSYNFPLNTQLEFQSRLNTVLKSFVTTLENSANPGDRELADKLKFNSLENDTRIDKVGLNLIAHLNQQKAKGASLNVQGYIENSPDFQHLSSREKEALSAEIFTLYNANPNINLDRFKKGSVDTEKATAAKEKKGLSTEARLRDLVGISLGSPFQGVSLDQFAAIQTKGDAQQFFESVVKNPNNFSQLSPEERTQFVTRGKDILEVLDYQFISHSRNYGIAAYLLLLIGGTSAGALSLHTVSKLKKHLQNRKNYLTDPVVVVEKLTEAEQEKLYQLNSMIQAHCKSIYTARNKAMARY
ncbi:MAG: hypothetical protein K2X66_06325, partial [Cyanobacteria bacterium]|nr:hypothetical protein [Cyanobacteriota bacterium]